MRNKTEKRKIKEIEEDKIVDIFKGDIIDAWKDNEFIYINFPFTTVSFPKELWEDIKQDLSNLGDL